MLAVAGGNLRVVLPEPRGGDEIAEMTRALVVFRDTAVEIEANGLREIALARQRLVDAIESISEGFALFDEHDHLVLCNRNYREMALPGSPETIVPGISFETIILRFAEEAGVCEPSGRHGDAFLAADDDAGKNDDWVASRKTAHLRLDGSPTLHHHQDRWLQIREQHAGTSGGVVVVASDVSESKQRELQLELALHLINEELTTARRLQLSMVPHDFPEWSKEQPVEIYAIMEPAREVGGDLYDFFLAAPGRMCFVVGDVSGKGAPAALFMARTRSLVRATVSIWHQATGDMLSPSAIAQAVNRELCLDNPERMFVSLFLGILDLETGEVDYINAGHPPAYLLSETIGPAAIEEVPDLPLGVRSRAQFRARSLYLRDEEALCLVTDGVLDAVNAGEAFFGKARLLETLSSLAGEAPTVIAARVRAAIDDFADGTPRFDDVTLLALRWLPSGARYHSRPVSIIESEADPSNAASGDAALTATAVARYS